MRSANCRRSGVTSASGLSITLLAIGIPTLVFGIAFHKGRLHREITAKQMELNQHRTQPRVGFAPTRDGGGVFTIAASF